MWKLIGVLAITWSIVASGNSDTEDFVKKLKKEPRSVLSRLPSKFKSSLSRGESGPISNRFSIQDIRSRKFVELKREEEQACRPESVSKRLGLLMAAEPLQSKSLYFDPPVTTNLETMERDSQQRGTAAVLPWSGDYWPIAKGVIGARNFDDDFAALVSWKERRNFVEGKTLGQIYDQGLSAELRTLSPSEKYELLIGDLVGQLTVTQWDQGVPYFEKDGEVALWMGICHGWAPASYMVPEPLNTVTVSLPKAEIEYPLFPAELKGLISYQWSLSNYENRVVGRRCHSKSPQLDQNGRIVEEDCFDVNPGVWHKVIVNRLGYRKKNFVMDATYDYEVWNQPVYDYKYSYFNPETGKSAESLAEARIPYSDFTTDIFKAYRSENLEAIVGIRMEVTYGVEVPPSDSDHAQEPKLVTVVYHYDLELSKDNQILGGEWYTNNHPDFLWTPGDDEIAYSYFDKFVGNTNWESPRHPLPLPWGEVGAHANQYGHLLGTVVKSMVEFSRSKDSRVEDLSR